MSSSTSTSTTVAKPIHHHQNDDRSGVAHDSKDSKASVAYKPKNFLIQNPNNTGTNKHTQYMNELHTIEFNEEIFVIPRKYRLERIMGQGSYGLVCSAVNTLTNERVAIKKNRSIFPMGTPDSSQVSFFFQTIIDPLRFQEDKKSQDLQCHKKELFGNSRY